MSDLTLKPPVSVALLMRAHMPFDDVGMGQDDIPMFEVDEHAVPATAGVATRHRARLAESSVDERPIDNEPRHVGKNVPAYEKPRLWCHGAPIRGYPAVRTRDRLATAIRPR